MATVKALVAQGARVTAVARGGDRLRALEAVVGKGLVVRQGDAADPAFLKEILRQQMPTLVVLAAGVTPRVAHIDEFDWESFSEAWHSDLKAAFLLVTSALTLPLRPGSTIVIVSSGAAVRGSPLSGGYAGAKRMQWFLANYAQSRSDARGLGIRFIAVVPEQLITGTTIAANASSAYAAMQGITAEEFMGRYDVQLTPDTVADAIVAALRGDVDPGVNVIAIRGTGIEALT